VRYPCVVNRPTLVQLSDTSWETEEERVAEAVLLKRWDASMLTHLQESLPRDPPKARREEFTTSDGYKISVVQGSSDVFQGPYLACSCAHFHDCHVTGRPQAAPSVYWLRLSSTKDTAARSAMRWS